LSSSQVLYCTHHPLLILYSSSQVLYALLDLLLFGPQPLDTKGGSTAPKFAGASDPPTTQLLARLQEELTLVPFVPGTCWQTRFNHLVSYGAGYYSYLYAKVFASHIWHECFAEDPLSREAGERLRRCMLEHGAAKEPADMLVQMLGGKEPSMDYYLRELGIDADDGGKDNAGLQIKMTRGPESGGKQTE
jgi:intermediate peptidase